MPNNQFDVTKVKIIPERTGPSLLTREYPKLSGFLQGLMGRAPDEVGGGSVLDEDAQSSRKLQALGAKYGFPIGTLAGMLPFGGGVAKAPSVVAGSRTAQKGIVRLAPGGNWLSGSAENAVRGLKRGTTYDDIITFHKLDPKALYDMPDSAIVPLERAMPNGILNNWIDSQLVKKYIKNEMATERDPLRLMADAWPEKKAAKLAEVQARIDALAERTRQLAIERGQPEHTLVEMRQLMIPLEKEKALIEATEGLHYTPAQQLYGPGHQTELRRIRQGFPEKGVAKAGLGTDWEDLSDRATQIYEAGNLISGSGAPQRLRADPWLAKVPPKTPVAGLHADLDVTRDLGFDHLIDELRNSLNPESGLPKELLMRYQDLPKVTVPQAAERVAQINAWRAAQKREADLLTANNAATVLHKDYPEKGMKWVEMKAPPKTGKNVEVQRYLEELPNDIRNDPATLRETIEEMAYDEGLDEGTPEFTAFVNGLMRDFTATKQVSIPEGHKMLEDALRYEGDQMAHCVGGYCPDVLEGRSRIFSLRDANGKPHVTIETLPPTKNTEIQNLQSEFGDAWEDYADPRLIAAGKAMSERIKQIKGYRNQKPDDEYLPYVQDFVRSGKWSDVGDLQNTGMQKWNDRYLTREDIEALSPDEMDAFASRNVGRGFADGGLVNTGYNPDAINTRAAQLMEELGL